MRNGLAQMAQPGRPTSSQAVQVNGSPEPVATVHGPDIAWTAGLFEGEGTVGYKVSSDRVQLRFALGTTDRDVLDRFRSIVGCGNITGPKWRELSTKPLWLWTATSHADCVHLTELFWEHLGDRRLSALERAWHEFATQPEPRHYHRDKTHCPYGHEYTEANTSREGGRRHCRACATRRRKAA